MSRYSDVVGGALGLLYDPRGIRTLMPALKGLHRAMFGDVASRQDERVRSRFAEDAPGILPGPYAARFGDTRGSTRPRATAGRVTPSPASPAPTPTTRPTLARWVRAAKRADRRSPWFGAAWTWASSVCAGWPASAKADRFAGPFDVTTDSPVLVVGNTYDPATPLHGARALNRMLDGSRLLVLDGWGHGAHRQRPVHRPGVRRLPRRRDPPARRHRLQAEAEPLFPQRR